MKDWIFAIFWSAVLSVFLIMSGGCRPGGDARTMAARKLCRQQCPKDKTFSYRVEFRRDFMDHHWACFCYPQFGAPVIKRFSKETVDAESKRKHSVPIKPMGEQDDW